MQPLRATIRTHTLEPLGKPALTLAFSEAITLGAGQFVLAHLPGSNAALRTRLFPVQISNDGFTCDHIPDPAWLPGRVVEVLGPLGKPFSPPHMTSHWLMLSLGVHPERLLPLLESGRVQSASMAFWSEQIPPSLPSDVERPVELGEAIDWADFIAIELPGPDWPERYLALRSQLTLGKAAAVQALVDVPTPCGFGVCQACAVPQRKGWSLGCQSGLVLSMEQIHG